MGRGRLHGFSLASISRPSEPIGRVQPTEIEANYHRQLARQAIPTRLTPTVRARIAIVQDVLTSLSGVQFA